jgi:anti-sigma factor RsiW
MTAPCRRSRSLLEPFIDGELPTEKVVEVEQHLSDCDCCREQVQLSRAMRESLRRVVREDAQPTTEFAARVARALAAEHAREERASERRYYDHGKPLAWRFIVPVAAAAGVTLVWGAAQYGGNAPLPANAQHASMVTSTPTVTAAVDQLLDEFVTYHAEGSDPEVTDSSLVKDELEPEVGVPVSVPNFKPYGLRWLGASVIPMRPSQHAASLRYTYDGHRVTLYVYNSASFPLRATLEPRVVRNMPVFVGSRRGYSIAAVEKRGVGYAVATDLDDSESAELVVASLH